MTPASDRGAEGDSRRRLLVDECFDAAGRVRVTEVVIVASEGGREALAVVESDTEAVELPEGALEAVFARFGRELDGALSVSGPSLVWGEGQRLQRFRHRDAFDVIGRDWLAFNGKASLATTIAAALRHVAAALRRAGGSPTPTPIPSQS